MESRKLIASDGTPGDVFGISVSISGNYVIVGACNDEDNGYESGSAYIFKREGINWIEEQKLLASDGYIGDRFGGRVSISENYAIVGAEYDDDNGDASGSAYIFRRDDTTWVEVQKLTANDGAAVDHFGYSLSISGDNLIVGAFEDDDNGENSGSAYIFSGFVVGVENVEKNPFYFQLEQNHPNPFNSMTTIKYQIPELSFVTIKVYDVLGNEITTLVNEEKQTGSYEIEFDGNRLTSGIYFYQLQACSYVETKKMIFLR